ncbi:MAG: cytochrome P450 [Burkholderiaceae bacterium]
MTAIDLEGFDLRHLPAGFTDNPYPWYAALRSQSPVRRMPDGSVLLTRYRDIEFVYKNPKIFSSDKKQEFLPKFGLTPLYAHHTTSLVFNDPPLHTRVRKILIGALTPKAIGQIEAGLIQLVDGLLDQLAADSREGAAVDLITGYASAIPVEVIGNLLGVPRGDRGPLRDWSLAILGALEPSLSEAQMQRGNSAVLDFLSYLRGLVAERRAKLGDPQTDVLTRLILGEGGTGELLSEEELLQNCIFILNAGHETTTNLIGNALVTLQDWPEALALLLADPSAIDDAIEEVLRFESSNQLGNRRALEDTSLSGTDIPKDTLITLCIGAANRDPEVFEAPDAFRIRRAHNKHLAFGSGIHLCAGMSLARLEGRVALGRFLQRFPRYRLAGPPVRGGRVRFRGFRSIPAFLA